MQCLPAISTHSQDCARGLAHPLSIQARQARILEFSNSELNRKAQLSHALHLLRASLKTTAELAEVLRCAGDTLTKRNPFDTLTKQAAQGLSELVDAITHPEHHQ